MDFFFFSQFCNTADLPEVSNFLVPLITTWIGQCCCVCVTWDNRACHSLQPALLVSSSALHSIPWAPCYCLCLHVLPSLLGTFLWLSMWLWCWGWHSLYCGQQISHTGLSFHPGGWWRWGFFLWSVWQWCSPPRWLRASRDTAHPVSPWVPSSCFSLCEASSLQTVFQWTPLPFHLNSTCSHPKVLSTCKIRLIENSVCLLQPDKNLFPVGH